MTACLSVPFPDQFDDSSQPAQGFPPTQARLNDEVRAASLLLIRHLARPDLAQAFGSHSRSAQNALRLDESRCGYEYGKIAFNVPADFKQKGHVEHRNRVAMQSAVAQEDFRFAPDQRVHYRLELRESGGIIEDEASQAVSVDYSVANGGWKGLGHERDGAATLGE